MKYLKVEKGKRTNYSVVLNFQGERTLLTYSYPRHYALPKDMEPAYWVYYTAIGKKHARLESQILRYARDGRIKIAFNPGTVHLKEGVRKIRDVLRAAEIIFVNKEEAEELVGDSAGMHDLLRRLHALGPRIAVITDGKNGAYASNTINAYYLPIYPMPFVEATGAGDAFATGFVAALFHGNTMPEALRWGAACAGSVVGKIGPQDGLPKITELHRLLHRFVRFQPKLIRDGRLVPMKPD
jgi:sugar/nucleoside kinase (ribokinase family)